MKSWTTKTTLSRAVEMNDYDDTALVARSRCNHVLGKNEEAINDGGCRTRMMMQ